MLRNRRALPAPLPAASSNPGQTRRPSGVPSIISAEMTIHGDLQSGGDLQIEGHVVGEIDVAKLVIAEGGSVTGNIIAGEVRISGSLTGTARAAKISLTATARVEGDLYHEILAIEAGGQLEGQSRRLVPDALLPAPEPADATWSEPAKSYEPAS